MMHDHALIQPPVYIEIMSSILDYLDPVDLIRAARSSKLLHEMAYDDTRWVQRLKRIGCWDEADARKHIEATYGTIANPDIEDRDDILTGTNVAVPAIVLDKTPASDVNELSDGFDKIELVNTSFPPESSSRVEDDPDLVILKTAKSIRGEARQEYGRIHGALAPFYNDIAKKGPSLDNLVFSQYKDPQAQAQMLSQLVAFSNSDMTDGWQDRTDRLQSTVAMFETAALNEFRNAYEADDIDETMRNYAHILWTLNGGKAAVDVFIHHNHLMTRKTELGTVADCIDASGKVKLQHTQAFFTRLSVAYNEEVTIMNRVFPPELDVASPFMEKVGQDVLYPFLTAIFDELHRTNTESYLTAVSVTFVQCMNLSESLLPIRYSGDKFDQYLDTVVIKIYEPHIDLYLAEELDFFRKGCEAAIDDWDRQLSEQAASTESFLMSNVNRQADKRDFLTSFKKVIMMPVNILPGFSGNKATGDTKADSETNGNPSAAKSPNRFSTIASPATPTLEEAPNTELAAKAAIMKTKMEGIKSLFSIEIALNLVHSAKSSLERAAQFVRLGGEYGRAAKQQCEAIFVALLRLLGLRHVIVGFDKAVDHLSNYRPREQEERDSSGVEPLVTFLELVNVGDLILQMVDVFYEQELVATRLTDRNDFLDPAVKEKKKFEQMLDERVAAGLNKGIDVLMEEVDYILATRQLATDFNPGVSSDPHRQTMDVGISKAAAAVVDVVSSHTQMLVGSTDKSTLDVFNQEVGLRLFTALCKHLKRQRISVEGSLKLIRYVLHLCLPSASEACADRRSAT